MSFVWLLGIATIAGLALRPRVASRFPLLFRTQQLLIGSTLAVLAGWSLKLDAQLGATVAVVILAEWSVLLAARLTGQGVLTGVAAHANAGFWSLPATSFLVPAALPVAVANSTLGMLRGAPALAWLRASSPQAQSARSGVLDFAPAIGLGVGWLAGRGFAPPIWAGSVLDAFARFIGVYGAFLVAAAMPSRWPDRTAWRSTLPSLIVRFALPSLVILAVAALGVTLSPLVWVLCLAPIPLNTLLLARVYELDAELAAAQLIATTAVALALLPVVALGVTA